MTNEIDYDEYIYQKLKEKIDTAISRKEFKNDPDLLFPEEFVTKETERKIYLKDLLNQFCGHVWQRAMQDLSVKNCEDLDKDDGSKTKGIDLLITEQDGTKYAVQFAKAWNTKNSSGREADHLKEYSANNNCKPVFAVFGKTSAGLHWDKPEWDEKTQIYKTYGRGNGELFGVDYDKIIDATRKAISRIIKDREEWLKG